MKRSFFWLLAPLVSFSTLTIAAPSGSIGLELTNDAIGAKYQTVYGKGEAFLEGFTDQDSGNFYGSLGFNSTTNLNRTRKNRMMLSLKGYTAHFNDVNDENFGVAAGAGYTHFLNTKAPLILGLSGYYGPNVLSVGASAYTELNAKAGIEIMPNAQAYLGYRNIRINNDQYGIQSLTNGFLLGISLAF